MLVHAEVGRRARNVSAKWASLAVAVLIGAGMAGCGAQPQNAAPEAAPALTGVHPCEAAALGATAPRDGAGGPFRGPGGATFSCATLTVPLDHAGPQAAPRRPGQLSLQVAMADNTTAPRGVLVWLVGGPGAPGVGLTAVIARQFDPAVLREYRLVLFSSRGTGAGALRCPELQQVMGDSDLAVPPPSAVRACARTIGDNRRFYTTADTLADLDTLRQALRVSTLTLDGASYGAFVAERYAITHPGQVARLVLDSPVPHDAYDPLGIAVFNRTAEVLRMVCARTPCATDPAADLAQAIRVRHDGPRLLNTLSGLTHGAPKLTGIPTALRQAANGENTALDAIIAAEDRNHATSAEQLSQGLHAATVCADWVWPWGDAETPLPARTGAAAKAVAALPDAALFPYDRPTAAGNGTIATCEQWPPTPVIAFPTKADLPPVPTLLLAGDHDLITPLAWTQHEAAYAPHGRLVVIPGSGHITQNIGNGPAGRTAVTAFLTGT
ncbi:MAG TPA: alpha/beta fold hydrolase [Pseudonocardiaceae bacterium]|nr:alpha/beta fold hydrolase [Pseudonocardiaceae bacterium]